LLRAAAVGHGDRTRPVDVVMVEYCYRDDRQGVMARCRRDGARQDVTVVDLTFPAGSRGSNPEPAG
jgi:hypothetical protein